MSKVNTESLDADIRASITNDRVEYCEKSAGLVPAMYDAISEKSAAATALAGVLNEIDEMKTYLTGVSAYDTAKKAYFAESRRYVDDLKRAKEFVSEKGYCFPDRFDTESGPVVLHNDVLNEFFTRDRDPFSVRFLTFGGNFTDTPEDFPQVVKVDSDIAAAYKSALSENLEIVETFVEKFAEVGRIQKLIDSWDSKIRDIAANSSIMLAKIREGKKRDDWSILIAAAEQEKRIADENAKIAALRAEADALAAKRNQGTGDGDTGEGDGDTGEGDGDTGTGDGDTGTGDGDTGTGDTGDE